MTPPNGFKKQSRKTFVLLGLTLFFSVGILVIDSIPNHTLPNGGESALWATLRVMPALFSLYGALCAALHLVKHHILYCLSSVAFIFLLFFFQRMFFTDLSTLDSALSALSGVILYAPCLLIGYGAVFLVRNIVETVVSTGKK